MIFLNEITITNKNGRLTVSSLQVATDFKKRHTDVCETIETLIRGCAEKSADLFIETKYQQVQNKQWYKCYDITRDGFSLLVMGFTGKKALEWKLKYIEAFNSMEKQLTDRNINLEEVIVKTVTLAVSETVKALVPLMKSPAPALNEMPDNEPKRIRKKYKHTTPSKISMLAPELKQKVDEMIISGEYSCQQIANFIMNNSDTEISQMAVNRYKRINFI